MFQQLPILGFDDAIQVDDKIIMEAIAKARNIDIAFALIDASTELKAKFFKNMPRSRASIIREEMIVSMRAHIPLRSELAQKQMLELINKKIVEKL